MRKTIFLKRVKFNKWNYFTKNFPSSHCRNYSLRAFERKIHKRFALWRKRRGKRVNFNPDERANWNVCEEQLLFKAFWRNFPGKLNSFKKLLRQSTLRSLWKVSMESFAVLKTTFFLLIFHSHFHVTLFLSAEIYEFISQKLIFHFPFFFTSYSEPFQNY